MMKTLLLSILLFLLGPKVKAQDSILPEFESIKRSLSEQNFDFQLKDPTKKRSFDGIFFKSLMPSPGEPLYLCLDKEKLKSSRYQVLLITEQKPMLLNKVDPSIYHVVMVKLDGPAPDPVPTGGTPSEEYIVKFRAENMDNVIHFANDVVEFRYDTGMQVSNLEGIKGTDVNPNGLSSETYDASKVNWVKKADLKLKLAPTTQIFGNVIIQESLGPLTGTPSSEWERMTFHTNQVNVNVGTVIDINSEVKVKSSISYEDSPLGRTAGALAGFDIRIPGAGQLMFFTAYKAPISLSHPNLFVPLSNIGGVGSGLKFKETTTGIELKTEVSGLGSQIPIVETGLSIPLEKPRK